MIPLIYIQEQGTQKIFKKGKTMNNEVQMLALNDGNKLPIIGFGTYKAKNAINNIVHAFRVGYRLFDTAWFYKNEDELGIAAQESNLKRSEYFLATKIWPNHFSNDLAKKSIEDSLTLLKTDYLDVVYLHWWGSRFSQAWKVLENYKEEGIIKSIAVSNFTKNHLDQLSIRANIKPALNQIEIHPLWPECELLSYLKKENIQAVAYCPLGRAKGELFDSDKIKKLCAKYSKTPAQIVLRWQVDRNTIAIPKSVHNERIEENFDIFDFELNPDEISSLESLGLSHGKISHHMDETAWLEEIENQNP